MAADTLVLSGRVLRDDITLQETSVFAEDIWQLAPAILRADRGPLQLNFTSLPAPYIPAAKYLFHALLTQNTPPGEIPISIESIRRYFSSVRRFLLWVHVRGQALIEVDDEALSAYHHELVAMRPSLSTLKNHRRAVRLLWAYRTLMNGDHLTLDPARLTTWQAWSRAQNRRSAENLTERIPEQVMAPLLTWALRWVDDFADDILAARQEQDALHRQRSDGSDPVDALRGLLARYRERHQPLPVTPRRSTPSVPNLAHLARQIGRPVKQLQAPAAGALITDTVADLGLDTDSFLDHRVRGTLEGSPWVPAISYYDLSRFERLLQVASWTVIAYLSGMRDSEIKHLRRGCVRVLRGPDARAYRYQLHSLAFKGERDPRGVPATWIVTGPVARAVAVLERLQPAGQPYLFAGLPGSRSRLRAGRVPGSYTTARALAAFVEWINDYCVAHERPDRIPDVRGAQPRLTTRQFRRTLARFIARRPGGAIAGALQYRHQRIHMFEGYAGTSDSGFRDEVQAEEALARGQYLGDLGADSDRPRLTGPAGAEAEQRLTDFARHTVFDGHVVTDEARLRRIIARHDPGIYPGLFVTCVYNPDRALCRADGTTSSTEPVLGDCRPLACRNTALTPGNRAAYAQRLAELDRTLADGDRLAPYVRHRLQQQREETAEFLARHTPEPA